MKTKKSLIYLFLLLTFISCKKDIKTNTEFKSIDFDSKTALSHFRSFKENFSQLIKAGTVKNTNSVNIYNAKTDFTILENIFYESTTKDYSFVEFQIEYKLKNGLLPNRSKDETDKAIIEATIDRLLVKRNIKLGTIDYELISYIPDKETLSKNLLLTQNKHDNLLANFSGHVYHKNIGGETMYLEVIKNGVVSKKLYKAKSNNGLKVQSTNKESYQYCDIYYCIEGYYVDETCQCFVYGIQCFTECYEDSQYPGVAVENGVLSFATNQDFQNLLAQLESETEAHNSSFFDSRDYMSDDEINDYADAIGFDEFKPLRDFENHFGFASLRQSVEVQTNNWMNEVEATACYYPANTTNIDDETDQTLITQNGQVKIAGLTYTIEVNASEICPGPSRCAPPSGIATNVCFESAKRSSEEEFDSDKIAYKILKFDGHGWPFSSNPNQFIHKPKAKGKVIIFKKKNNGGKRRFAMKSSARVFGNVYSQDSNLNCPFREAFDTEHNPTKRRYRRKNREPFYVNSRTKWCQVTSEFKINSNTFVQYLN